MEQTYEVRFAKSDPETPPTTPPIMEDQNALARVAARQLGVPNAESAPPLPGRQEPAGEAWAYVGWTWEGLR